MSVFEVISELPGTDRVRELSLSLAVLDALLSPDWEARTYSFDATWAPGQQAATMRDGSGDEYAIVFGPDGAWAAGFHHESEMSPFRTAPPTLWPGLVEGLPTTFTDYVTEPAFCGDGVLLATVCFWRESAETEWSCGPVELPAGRGPDPDGARCLFDLLVDGRPAGYLRYAADYFETDLPETGVAAVYDQRPLTDAVARALNPEVRLDDIAAELSAMGYPLR